MAANTRTAVRQVALAKAREALVEDCTLTLREIAERVPCDPGTVGRAFAAAGSTFSEERLAARMELAGNVLMCNGTVREAATGAGYVHARHFATAFRAFYGTSPSAVRRAGRLARRLRDRIEASQVPPGSSLYSRRRRGLQRNRDDLGELVKDIRPDTDVALALREALELRRPDFRTRETRNDPRARPRLRRPKAVAIG